MNIGEIEGISFEPWLKVANILTAYDDPILALDVLKKLPAYYRDNPPDEIIKLKNKILEKLATPAFYANSIETEVQGSGAKDYVQGTLRGQLVYKDIKELNEQGIVPHIFELAPGTYWLPIGLLELGLNFTYCARSLNPDTKAQAKRRLGSIYKESKPEFTKSLFLAFEIIEHLHHLEDIAAEYYRYGMGASIIHVSTPKYTFDGRQSSINWEDKDLGHLRTFTPREFCDSVIQMFQGYQWQLHDAQVMQLRGVINGN